MLLMSEGSVTETTNGWIGTARTGGLFSFFSVLQLALAFRWAYFWTGSAWRIRRTRNGMGWDGKSSGSFFGGYFMLLVGRNGVEWDSTICCGCLLACLACGSGVCQTYYLLYCLGVFELFLSGCKTFSSSLEYHARPDYLPMLYQIYTCTHTHTQRDAHISWVHTHPSIPTHTSTEKQRSGKRGERDACIIT